MTQLLLDLGAPPAPTLANFVVGRNAEVLAALRAPHAGTGADPAGRFVYLWGESGSGRSHLLRAVADASDGFLCSATALDAALARRLTGGDDGAEARVIAIDDIDEADAASQEALLHLIIALREHEEGAIVIAGNAPPRGLALAPGREDLRSRLAWGLVFEVRALDDEEKDTALARHAAERGLALPAEVRGHLLTHFSRDMPSLMRLVDALDRYALERQRAVTVPLLRDFTRERLQHSLSFDHAA